MTQIYETGFFALPGEVIEKPVVHATKDREPICGIVIDPHREFRFYSLGIYRPYVTCRRCLARIDSKTWQNRHRIFIEGAK